MNKKIVQLSQLSGRAKFLAIATITIVAIFVIRLFYLQIIQHDFYVAQANSEQVKQHALLAERGLLYSYDNGKPVKLVYNETVYTVFIDPKIINAKEEIVDELRKVAGGNVRKGFEELFDKKESRYQIVAKKVSRKQAELLKSKNFVGLGFQPYTQRVYPEGDLASQVLGFVNSEGKGVYGIEGGMDSELSGEDGLLQTVTDVRDVPLTIGSNNINKPAKDGDDIVLTIDRNIQAITERALKQGIKRSGAERASAVVINPQNGHVMAMANYPSYNPAEYGKVEDAALFNNATISSPYEPGSVIKPFMLSVGIDKGVISPNTRYINTDKIVVGDRTITNASKGQTGSITMQHALNWSLNTGMVTVAKLIGGGNIGREVRETMFNYYHNKYGFGKYTGIELMGEADGLIYSPKYSEGNAVRYSNMSFGQGMNLTMLQVAAGFSALVNGGDYYSPTIVAGTVDEDDVFIPADQKTIKRGVISSSTSSQVREMVYKARQEFYKGKDRKGYMIGGKTGTSQTLRDGVYIYDETVGSYLGFGGDTAPRYVIMTQISGKGMALEGGKDASPIFTEISNWMVDYLKLKPKK